MVGKLSIADRVRETLFRFRNFTNYEKYLKAIDQDYEPEDAIFNGFVYKKDPPQFNLVNRSQYRNGFDFKHKIKEYRGKFFFIPIKGYCFGKCVNFLTGEDYKKNNISFLL